MILIYKDLTLGSMWKHTSGNKYVICQFANCEGDDPTKVEKYPPMVIYQGANGKHWARRADDWHRSMTEVKDND